MQALPCAPAEVDEFLSRPLPVILPGLEQARGPFLVLGAGGKMGLHVSAMLQRGLAAIGRKDRVVAVSRFSTLNDRQEFAQFGVETIQCDLTDDAALAALPDAPTVIFMAGVKFGTSDAPGKLLQINQELPRRVAARFARSRIVAYSSGCVYPFVSPGSGGATERTPMAAVGGYAASCIARETAFMEASRRQGTPVVLIRLNYAVEFRYGVLVDIAQKVLAGSPIDLTTGHVNVIWQSDAVAQSIQSLALAAAPAVPLNVTGPGVLAVRDLALKFGAILNRTPQFSGEPADSAWLNNAAVAHRTFGLPSVSLDQMMEWVAAWLARGEKTWNKPTGYDKRDGRF